MSTSVYDVIRRPIITEKGTEMGERGQYAFEVARDATKPMIREAVQKIFKVEVVAVNTMNVRGKMRRVGKSRGMSPDWKKAIVTLAPGQRIDFFEGV